jgi:outer membrane receptor for ferrienterochelin and colicin
MENAAYVGTANKGLGVPAISYFDLDMSWDITPSLQLRGGITNLLGKDPPYLDFQPNGTDPYTYDLIGRRGFVALKVKL